MDVGCIHRYLRICGKKSFKTNLKSRDISKRLEQWRSDLSCFTSLRKFRWQFGTQHSGDLTGMGVVAGQGRAFPCQCSYVH